MESISQAPSRPTASRLKTLVISSEKVRKEAQAGVCFSHYAVPQKRALPVRLLITYATLAFSVANVYGCRLKSMSKMLGKDGRIQDPCYNAPGTLTKAQIPAQAELVNKVPVVGTKALGRESAEVSGCN